MSGKISKINMNGQILNIDDEDAVQLPEEATNGDVLVYDAEHNKYISLPAAVAINLINSIKDQNLPVTSSAVFKAMNAANTTFRNGVYSAFDEILLKFDYKNDNINNNTIIRAKAYLKEQIGRRDFNIGSKLDIAVFCLDSDYDQNTQTYYMGNFVGIITIKTDNLYRWEDEWTEDTDDVHYSGYLPLPIVNRTRKFNFIVLNPVCDTGQIRKIVNDNIVVPSNTAKTITMSTTDLGYYNTQLIATLSSSSLNDDIKLKVTVYGGRNNDIVEVYGMTILSGNDTATLDIGMSGFDRTIEVELLDSGSEDYVVVNNYIKVRPRIENRLLLITFTPEHCLVQIAPNFQNNSYFSIISNFTRYKDLIELIDINTDINIASGGTFKVTVVNDTGSEPDPIYVGLDGIGYTKESFIEEFDIPDTQDIKFEGHNIHNDTFYGVSAKLYFDKVEPLNSYNGINKYRIIDNVQYEVWFVDDNGYLVDACTDYVKYNWQY